MPEIEEIKQTEEKRPAAPVIPFTKNELREMLGKGTLAGDTSAVKAARGTLAKDIWREIFRVDPQIDPQAHLPDLLPDLWSIVQDYLVDELESKLFPHMRGLLFADALLKDGISLKDCLFAFIHEARGAENIREEKEKESKAILAGNAFTLLNKGDVPFSGKIFSQIYARGVNLSGGILHATRFEDCRLVDLDITGAYAQAMQVVRTHLENFQCENPEYSHERERMPKAPPSYWRARTNGQVEILTAQEEKEEKRMGNRSFSSAHLMCPADPADTQLFSTRFVGNQYYAEIVVWDVTSGQLIKYENGYHGCERLIEHVTPPEKASDGAMITFRKSGDIHKPTLFYFHKDPETEERFVNFDKDIYTAHYLPQHALFAGIGRDGSQYQAYIWDVKTPQNPQPILQISSKAKRVAFSPDGKYLAILYFDRIEMWSVASGTPTHVFRTNSLFLAHIYFSPNGQWIAATAEGGTGEDKDEAVFIWKNEPEKYSSVQPQMPFHVYALDAYLVSIGHFAFSPDSNFWAVSVAQNGNFLSVWETASKELKTKFQTSESSTSIVWKQINNDLLLVTSSVQGIFCWDVLRNPQGEMNLRLRWTTYQRKIQALRASFEIVSTASNENALVVLRGAGAQVTLAPTTATPAVVATSTVAPLSRVETQPVDVAKPHQRYSRWRILFFVLGAAAIFALCFSPLGPLVFSTLPIAIAAALTSAVTFATTAACAGWTILAAAVITGFIVANLDRALIIVAALTLNVLKAVFSLCAFICNAVVVPLANYLMRSLVSGSFGFLETVGWACLILLWLPAFITGSLMMGVERLRQSSLYHRAVMEVRNLFGKANPISRWPVEAPLTYSQAVGDIREFNCLHMFQNFKACAVRYGCDATLDVFKENNPEVSSSEALAPR